MEVLGKSGREGKVAGSNSYRETKKCWKGKLKKGSIRRATLNGIPIFSFKTFFNEGAPNSSKKAHTVGPSLKDSLTTRSLLIWNIQQFFKKRIPFLQNRFD